MTFIRTDTHQRISGSFPTKAVALLQQSASINANKCYDFMGKPFDASIYSYTDRGASVPPAIRPCRTSRHRGLSATFFRMMTAIS